ncbi:hypothetical protein DH2020_025791 [Rehmannia glutinosa]|uniref:Uncharacterized protein n=1 Tax=Rehmannia glutinosa TaxID=99300 RepID=A0ABR0VYQ6_REHGL
MNENQHLEVHYMDSGYSYPPSEGFMDFFGGVSAAPYHYVNMGPMHDQESQYWSMHMSSYKYGLSGQESTYYYGLYEDVDHAPRMDFNRRAWDYPSMANTEDPIAVDVPSEQSMVSAVHSIPEESSPHQEDAVSTQVLLQDDIDPDTMTYENSLKSQNGHGFFFGKTDVSFAKCDIKEGTDKSICHASMHTILIAAPSGLASTRHVQFATLRYLVMNQAIDYTNLLKDMW